MDYDRANAIIGNNLRALRAKRDYSRDKLSELTGIPVITLRRGESGERAVPVPTLLVWLRALGADAAEFIDSAQREIDKG